MSHRSTDRPANRLGQETSPYLLQHAHNPVDWFPWGPEAFEKARSEGRPIFLSVGYSACHWCHVMERESFENPDIAAVMNEHFVNVKVDREERPDVDQIYMSAVQAMTGHGGWPMSVFLTPDQKPFYGGTYFPPHDRQGMPGFPRVLLSVARAWAEKQDDIGRSAHEMTEQIRDSATIPPGSDSFTPQLIDQAARALARNFEPVHGGFGHAPKFPHVMDLKLLLRHYHRTRDAHSLHMVRHTLDKMARGGIYDHLGGGFARYSTDERWLAPHFEKMLYDNALLAGVYLEAFQVTRDAGLGRVAREILDYVLGRMTDPAGGFYATEDADSEGEEGKFYVWTLDEIRQILGAEDADTFAAVYDATPAGNWEGHTILNLPRPVDQAAEALGRSIESLEAGLARSRSRLLEARERRIPPGKDTKILTSWNGLMLAPMADAAFILGDRRYLDAACQAADFLITTLVASDGRLLHGYKDGRARFNGYLDDYACLIDGLTHVFEASGEARWIFEAIRLAEVMMHEFADPEGGFFYTGKGHEALITRSKDVYDNATPSGNGMAATALLRLAALTGRVDLAEAGRRTLAAVRLVMERAPMAASQSLIALDFHLTAARAQEIAVIAGPDSGEFDAMMGRIHEDFRPGKVVAPAPAPPSAELAAAVPLLADRQAREGRTTVYLCENFVCRAPITGLAELGTALAD